MDVHEALSKVGTVTPWSFAILMSLGLSNYLTLVSNFFAIIFMVQCMVYGICGDMSRLYANISGLEPKYECKLDNSSLSDEIYIPGTCEINVFNQTHNYTLPCTGGWKYQQNPGESIVTEWDLVCRRDYLVSLSVAASRAVAIVGELFCPMFIDYFGRKRIHIVLLIAFAVLSILSAFSTSYTMFLVLRLCIGVFILAVTHSGYALIAELYAARLRGFVGVIVQIQWAISCMIVTLFAYFIRPWRHLQAVLHAIPFIFLLYIRFLPESPVWLVANNRNKEAEDVLNLLARRNKIQLDSPVILSSGDSAQKVDLLEENRKRAKATSVWRSKLRAIKFLDLFKGSKVLRHTLIMSILWLVNQLVYYGMMYNLPALSQNIYLSFFLMSLVEIPAYLCSSVGVDRLGRRILLITFHLMVSVSLILLEIVPSKTSGGVDLGAFSLTLALVGKFAITGSFIIIVVLTPELFPTNLRGTALGFVNVLGLIGGTVSPFMGQLGKIQKWIPSVIFAVTSGSACLLVFLLPETNKRPLPITRGEIREWYREKNRKRDK